VPPTPRTSQKALQGLSTLFKEELKNPAAIKDFFANPSRVKELDLPRGVAAHFEKLSFEELRLLADTWDAMERGKLTYEARGVKVTFL
jgi:hypothetical protein